MRFLMKTIYELIRCVGLNSKQMRPLGGNPPGQVEAVKR